MSTATTNSGWSEDDVAHRIGLEYVEGHFENEDSIRVQKAYYQISKRNSELYRQIPIPVLWTEDDPYSSYEELREGIRRDGELRVFSGGSHPKFVNPDQNVKGRAVHDYFGHYRHDVDFSVKGEFLKWWHTRHHFPDLYEYDIPVREVLFAEIVGQRCAVGYLDDGFGDQRFEQRAIAAPRRWIELCKEAFL